MTDYQKELKEFYGMIRLGLSPDEAIVVLGGKKSVQKKKFGDIILKEAFSLKRIRKNPDTIVFYNNPSDELLLEALKEGWAYLLNCAVYQNKSLDFYIRAFEQAANDPRKIGTYRRRLDAEVTEHWSFLKEKFAYLEAPYT